MDFCIATCIGHGRWCSRWAAYTSKGSASYTSCHLFVVSDFFVNVSWLLTRQNRLFGTALPILPSRLLENLSRNTSSRPTAPVSEPHMAQVRKISFLKFIASEFTHGNSVWDVSRERKVSWSQRPLNTVSPFKEARFL
jgi:hypothetical protein